MKNKDKTLYVVSGFMRTGTSMMMRALEAGGLDAEYKESRDEMKDRLGDEKYDPNVGGLYELERSDYQDNNFPRGYEGKLIKALNGGVPGMRTMENGIRVVFMRRDAEEIRQSYDAFFGNQLQAVATDNQEQFQERMGLILEKIRNRKDVKSVHEFWFRDVIESSQQHFQELKDAGWNIDVQKASGIVDPELYRYREENLIDGII